MRPRRRDWIFDEFFRDLEKEFRQIEEDISRILGEGLSGDEKGGRPFVYGFSFNVGPNGEPRIDRFGNIPNSFGEPIISDEREPLVDVVETDGEVLVVAELPGVEKRDIALNVSENVLEIDVDSEARRYHKTLILPDRVDADSTKATYKNGVLEVRLTRLNRAGNSSTRVDIE